MSLLELLLALILMALMAAAIAAMLGFGLQLRDRSTTTDAQSDAITARVRLREFLAEALPPPVQTPGFPTAFEADVDGFSFTTLAARHLASGAAALRISVRQFGSTLELRISRLSDTGQSEPLFNASLATNVANIKFSYLDMTLNSPVWRSSWKDPTRLPTLVRIEIPEGSMPDWPEFTVRTVLAP